MVRILMLLAPFLLKRVRKNGRLGKNVLLLDLAMMFLMRRSRRR